MRIRIPNYQVNGNVIIEYKDANINPFYCSTIIEKVVFHSQLKINFSNHDFVLEFKIQDGTKRRYCIIFKSYYLQDKILL
jgi:hypothetical protein